MKLKNKKTGKIVDFGSPAFIIDNTKNSVSMRIKNLAELDEEWEDVPEEPEDGWCIGFYDAVKVSPKYDALIKEVKLIGNYFETKEEAEKAVEKLKAWKRLKDKGFRFWTIDPIHLKIGYSFENYTEEDIPELKKDLYFCFGGEE